MFEEKQDQRGCRKCRRMTTCAEVGGLFFCAQCLGGRQGSMPRKLVAQDLASVPLPLRRAVGRVAWQMSFVDLTVTKTVATMVVFAHTDGSALAAQGWKRGADLVATIPTQCVWTLSADDAEAMERSHAGAVAVGCE